MESERISLKRS